jgi:selenocysteine lyase/cysteine desulfurase
VLAFSHVNYADGTLMPVRELCQFARQRNILTVVDGAQAIGMLDFLLRDLECDCYAACFHKWANGSHGTGALYVKREMLDRIWPSAPRGLDAAPPIATPTLAPGFADSPAALRRMGNIVPLAWPALRGSEAALEFQQQIGRSRIEARVRELAIYARLRLQQLDRAQMLTPARPGSWGGILTVRLPGRPAETLANTLVKIQRVHVRAIEWAGEAEGALRVSVHIHNTHDEIDKLALGLQQARL